MSTTLDATLTVPRHTLAHARLTTLVDGYSVAPGILADLNRLLRRFLPFF